MGLWIRRVLVRAQEGQLARKALADAVLGHSDQHGIGVFMTSSRLTNSPYSVPDPLPNGPVVYLLHFERPYQHAQHYIGWSDQLETRLAHHASGNGARLTAAVAAAGIAWTIARLWLGADRHFERRLHRRKDTRRLCPACSGDSAMRRERAS